MITEAATVVRIDGDSVWVRCDAQRACQRCAEGRGCGGGVLGRLLGDRLRTVRAARAGLSVSVGDSVVIGLAETALVKASVAMYLVPLITMLAGALVAWRVAGPGEIPVMAGGLVGFVAGLLYARRFGSRHRHDPRYQPVVVGRRNADESPACPVATQ